MELHNLKPNKGATKNRKRVGRGEGSHRGGTSTRGHKGAKSRSGFKRKAHFEGGQTPLQMRVPKRGFNSPNRTTYQVINLDQLQHYADKFETTTLDLDFFRSHRVLSKSQKIKVLGDGNLTGKVTIEAHAASKSAAEAIDKAGGKLSIIEQ